MFVLLLFCFLFCIHCALAIPGRVLQGCTTVGTNVYCYGGYSSASGGVFTNDTNDHVYFDMSQTDTTKATTSPTWITIVPPNNTTLERRSAFEITTLDNNRYMVLGGSHYITNLTTAAAIYDTVAKTWTALVNPPVYMSEGTMVSSDANTVWAYGGKLNNGYATASLMKLVLPNTWSYIDGRQFAPPVSPYGHASIIKGSTIYFFGGFYNLPEINLQPNPVPLFNVSWYNTATDQWGMDVGTGNNNPTPRKYHTASLIEGSSKVLIYGGTNVANLQALPIQDYCYIYDLDTKIYTSVNMTGDIGAGPRIGHSAILYKQSIFILFGYDANGNIQNDAHVIDVSNPGAPIWAGQSRDTGNNGTNTNNNNNGTLASNNASSSNSPSSGIGSGAIAGIVVGVVGAAAVSKRRRGG
ncbi:hypothetical protein BC941DRAFT_428264 [Chlamydoabsidia padenii]|nr:hypothetical protein BC941DRAFT_428264 [Chlamydoabsidia padenii]